MLYMYTFDMNGLSCQAEGLALQLRAFAGCESESPKAQGHRRG
jgi:hypothetical protein